MKKILLIVLLGITHFVESQNVNEFPAASPTPSLQNTSKLYCGIGTYGLTPITPRQNLHINGKNDYNVVFSPPKVVLYDLSDPMNGVTQLISTGETTIPQTTINFGKTSAIAFTNTLGGTGLLDGAQVRLSENDFYLENFEENGDLGISSSRNVVISNGSTPMEFNKAQKGIFINGLQGDFFGNTTAAFNITASFKGGFLVTTNNTSPYGVSVKCSSNDKIAFQVFGGNGQLKNFSVLGSGEVYARKYTTTLNAIPDYVFEPSYNLMPITDLRTYLAVNKHLPNIPSAKEIEANEGQVDLGEMNRLLLEKVEESMLYILQLEERIKALEQK